MLSAVVSRSYRCGCDSKQSLKEMIFLMSMVRSYVTSGLFEKETKKKEMVVRMSRNNHCG